MASVSGPKSIVMTINAGVIDANHWIQDLDVGGRIIEKPAILLICRFIIGVPINSYTKNAMNTSKQDTATLQLSFCRWINWHYSLFC